MLSINFCSLKAERRKAMSNQVDDGQGLLVGAWGEIGGDNLAGGTCVGAGVGSVLLIGVET